MKPTADEFNISASMEPVTVFDATAHTNSEWPDEQKSAEWNGEDGPYNGLVSGAEWVDGLPPVGEVCEYVVSDRIWAKIEITAHARHGICFCEIGKSGENYVGKNSEKHRFRPLRTAEQQAADEREKAIDEMLVIIGNLPAPDKSRDDFHAINDRNSVSALYDAGYRLTAKD